jgi:hypothetical protein
MPRDPSGPGRGSPIGLEPLARRALYGWLLLGGGALALAGVLALLLAVARTPGADAWLPWAQEGAFRKILVSHVDFAFVLWFWAMLGGLAVAARGNGRTGLAGLALALVGAVMVLVPALADRGQPVMSNYIPVLTDWVFVGGLGLFALGAMLPAGHLLADAPRVNPLLTVGIAAAAAIFLLAAICFVLAWRDYPPGTDLFGHMDTLFWGAGHLLQFVYTALLLTAWECLGTQAFGVPPLGLRAWRTVCALLVIAAVPGPVLYMAHEGDPEQLRGAFTQLYVYGLPIPVAAMAIATLVRIWQGPRDWRSPAFLGVVLSLAQFLFGGLLGIFADGTDTRTPAHYHAEIGAVNLALIGLIFAQLLPALGREGTPNRATRLQFWIYGIGQAVASLGLFLAGTEGVGRKVAGAAQGLDTLTKKIDMGLAGAGGVFAVIGGVLFIWLLLRRLLAANAR